MVILKMKKKAIDEPCYCCDVCGEEHGFDDLKIVKVKGRTQRICKECVAAIKGIT